MSLRVLLIIIGVAIVAGVYFFSTVKRRRDSHASFGRRFERLEIPDVILRHEEDADEDVAPRPLAEADLALSEDSDAAPDERAALPDGLALPDDAELEELPRVRNDAFAGGEPGNGRRSSSQLDLFGAEVPVPEAAPTPSATKPKTGATPGGRLINLFVRAPARRPFGGPELVRALNAVGLQHGEMSIFHHFGSGELRREHPIFSAANMFEPGTFDLTKIEAFETSGIVLFMELPTPLEGPVAFELLLNTAQRLAELTGGELFATPRTPLDAQAIARMRQIAADHGDARA